MFLRDARRTKQEVGKPARLPHYVRDLPFRLDGRRHEGLLPAAIEALRDGDPDRGLESLRRAARDGEPGAASLLGRILLATAGAAEHGVSWLHTAARAGDCEALHLLGLAYFRGQGVEKDLTRARRLQTEAAERGVIEAQFELSILLAQGLGGRRDARGARHWEGKAADAGHPRACLNRATRAARARPPDFAEAMRWYERAAEAGSAEAAARLCRMHLAGQGGVRDEVAAKRWYERAAELGHDWSAERHG